MVVQLCEYTETIELCRYMGECVVYELNLNKAVKKQSYS